MQTASELESVNKVVHFNWHEEILKYLSKLLNLQKILDTHILIFRYHGLLKNEGMGTWWGQELLLLCLVHSLSQLPFGISCYAVTLMRNGRMLDRQSVPKCIKLWWWLKKVMYKESSEHYVSVAMITALIINPIFLSLSKYSWPK